MSRREEIARQRDALRKAETRRQQWTDVIISTVITIIAELVTFNFWHPSPGNTRAVVAVGIVLAAMGLVALRRKLR